MAICKYCNVPFQWGRVDDRWVPLVPIGEDAGLERGYQDEDGALRAAHRLICTSPGGAAVRAVRLPRPVPASALIGTWSTPDLETGEIKPIPGDHETYGSGDYPSIKRKKRGKATRGKGEPSAIDRDDDSIPF